MQSTQDEMLYNWTNTLRKSEEGARFVASQTAMQLKDRGFNAREALDMMAADNFDLRLAETAVVSVYEPEKQDLENSAPREAMVVPTSYAEVKEFVEQVLAEHGAQGLIERLAKSSDPIVRVSRKTLAFLSRLANEAAENPYALEELHKEITPWVEEALYSSVLIAKQKGARVAVASQSDSQYQVGRAAVDLAQGTCDCTKFSQSNFADFGLACEHIVIAAHAANPHQRLMRALKG